MALSMHDFTSLMLAQLTKCSKKCYGISNSKSIASIPFDYKERIENILCEDNGWKEEFSILIDVKEYFKDHFYWEEKLAKEIQKIGNEVGKEMYFDIISEYIVIEFNTKDIELILNKFDIETNNVMRHFTSVMVSHIYSRRHKEEIFDHSARTTAKMHNLWEESLKQGIMYYKE